MKIILFIILCIASSGFSLAQDKYPEIQPPEQSEHTNQFEEELRESFPPDHPLLQKEHITARDLIGLEVYNNKSYVEEALEAGYGSSFWDRFYLYERRMDLDAARDVYRKDFIKKLFIFGCSLLFLLGALILVKRKKNEIRNAISKGAEQVSISALRFINFLWYILPLLILVLIVVTVISLF